MTTTRREVNVMEPKRYHSVHHERLEAYRELERKGQAERVAHDPEALKAYNAKAEAERKRNEDGTYV
jgi:hypothetical protein